MRRQGVSFSSLHTPSSLNVSGSPRHVSPDHSILRSANRPADKSADRSGAAATSTSSSTR